MTLVKVAVVGDGTVGKSSLISRFVNERGFSSRYAQTIGVDFYEKRIRVRGDVETDLQIWDIGGQSIRSKMLDKYVGHANAVIVVYDLTNHNSLLDADEWIDRVRATAPGALIFLAGNKADLHQYRQVSDGDHDLFWKTRKLYGAFKTSAATGENVAKAVYQASAASVGITLTRNELDSHTKVLPMIKIREKSDEREGRTPDADRIEAEDLAAEAAKHRRHPRCCTLA